jgi:hypothetical protein
MRDRVMMDTPGRRFGFFARTLATLIGVALISVASWVIILHGWMGVIEGLPALALGASALFLAVVGREPGWWRSS